MELDELKQTWKQTNFQKNINPDFMELIQHKSYGPLAALKKSFLKDIRLMIVMPVVLVLTNLDDPTAPFTSILFWFYCAFCVGIIAFSAYNYRLVNDVSRMDVMTGPLLQRQLNLLETRLKWHMNGVRIVSLFFILLLETVPFIQHYRMLDKWHSLSPWIRFGSYAAFLVLQHFMSKKVCERKFGAHINYLKGLVKEMSAG